MLAYPAIHEQMDLDHHHHHHPSSYNDDGSSFDGMDEADAWMMMLDDCCSIGSDPSTVSQTLMKQHSSSATKLPLLSPPSGEETSGSDGEDEEIVRHNNSNHHHHNNNNVKQNHKNDDETVDEDDSSEDVEEGALTDLERSSVSSEDLPYDTTVVPPYSLLFQPIQIGIGTAAMAYAAMMGGAGRQLSSSDDDDDEHEYDYGTGSGNEISRDHPKPQHDMSNTDDDDMEDDVGWTDGDDMSSLGMDSNQTSVEVDSSTNVGDASEEKNKSLEPAPNDEPGKSVGDERKIAKAAVVISLNPYRMSKVILAIAVLMIVSLGIVIGVTLPILFPQESTSNNKYSTRSIPSDVAFAIPTVAPLPSSLRTLFPSEAPYMNDNAVPETLSPKHCQEHSRELSGRQLYIREKLSKRIMQ